MSAHAPHTSDAQAERVFISYGRRDALEFAVRLAEDLRRRGHAVWLDLTDIEAGGPFEVRIERGISDSTVVAAVMTRRSLEEESVCRDEVAYALASGRRLVPLRLDPDPTLRPSLLLARRNWIDFTGDYQTGLDALLRYLSGDDAAARRPPLHTVAGLAPLDFGPEIARHAAGFTGREWLGAELDRWLDVGRGRAFVVVAGPGFGKSAVAAWLSLTRPDLVLAVHFCTHRFARSLDPEEFVASLAAQLHARLPGYADAVERRYPAARQRGASDAFRELIVGPARDVRPPEGARLVVVDALDEAEAKGGETILALLAEHAPDLPEWLRVVATTRPEAGVVERVSAMRVFELEAHSGENRADLGRYVETRLARVAGKGKSAGADAETVRARLEELADGNFLYARLALDALEDGTLAPSEVGRLSPGLASFYVGDFARRFPAETVYRRDYAPLLRALAAARAPLPFPLLCAAAGLPAEEAHARLRRLHAYLREPAPGTYALFHKSLAEWLTEQTRAGAYFIDAREGHHALAGAGLGEARRGAEAMSDYARTHTPAHLAAAGLWDELLALVFTGGLGLLSRWIDGGESEVGVLCLEGLIAHLKRARRAGEAAGLSTQAARIHSKRGDYERADAHLADALRHTSLRRGRRARAIALHERGSLQLYRAEYGAAARSYRAALRLCLLWRPVYRDEAGANLVGLATVALERRRFRRAALYAAGARLAAKSAGDAEHLIAAGRLTAAARRALGRYREAEGYVEEAARLCRETGARTEAVRVLTLKGWLLYDRSTLTRAAPDAAAEVFREALAEAELIGSFYSTVEARLSLSWCALVRGDDGEAHAWLAQMGEPSEKTHAVLRAGRDLARAVLARRAGEAARATEAYGAVVEFCRRHDLPGWRSRAHVALGAALLSAGEASRAEAEFRAALDAAAEVSPARRKLAQIAVDICRADPLAAPR